LRRRSGRIEVRPQPKNRIASVNYHTIRTPDQIRRDAARKLREAQISDDFLAILGCLLEEGWTTPRLLEICISPDGLMLGRPEDLDYPGKFLGTTRALFKDIQGLAQVAALDGDEVGYLVAKVAEIKRQK
jgi:hypothetical protein